jgi:hypothetical protein
VLRRKSKKSRSIKRATKTRNINQEIGFIGKALRGLGNLSGSALGGMVGMPQAGGALGSSLGAAVSKWLGAGDYTVSKNSIVSKAANGIPLMHNTGQSVVVRHREFIGPISGSVDFTIQYNLTINPGMASTFPWLSSIAGRFQEYEFKGMVFHYVPTSGTFNGTTAALGAVMLQTTYRATDSAPTSKAEMMNEYCANEVVPFETTIHPIECDPKENPFAIHYIRNRAILTGDALLYDLGTTFIATQGMADTSIVGDLWVTYEVELKKPLISSPVVNTEKYYGVSYASPTTSSFFDGAIQGDPIGQAPATFALKTITFPAGTTGTWMVYVEIFSTGGLSHATSVAWSGADVVTNLSGESFDGFNSSETYTTTGTLVATNTLRRIFAFSPTDVSLPVTITLPNAQWSSGSTSGCNVVLCRIGI